MRKEILKHYNIGTYKYHREIWAIRQKVYILRTSKGKYLLKFMDNTKLDFKKFRIKLIDYLDKEKIPVAKIIHTKSGNPFLLKENNLIIMQEFIEGFIPKRFSDKLVKDIARDIGLLSQVLRRVKGTKKYTWGEYQFKTPLKWGSESFKGFNLKENMNSILKALRKINRKKLRRSLIHGDLTDVHLLVKNDKLNAIIDWDDAHEDFLIQEIAVFIARTFVTGTKVQKDKIRLFMREYQKRTRLNKEEKKALYYFIRLRHLGGVSWQRRQLAKHKGKSRKKIEKSMSEKIDKYKVFSKIPLEEFLEICK